MTGTHAGLRTRAALPLSAAPAPVTQLGALGFISGADPWLAGLVSNYYGSAAAVAPPGLAPPMSKAGLPAVITAVIALSCVCLLLAAAAVVLWYRCSRASATASAGGGGGGSGKRRSLSAHGSRGSRGSSAGGSRSAVAVVAAAAAAVAAEDAAEEARAAATTDSDKAAGDGNAALAEVQTAAAASAQLTSDGHGSAEARSGVMDIAVDSICEPQLSHRSSTGPVRLTPPPPAQPPRLATPITSPAAAHLSHPNPRPVQEAATDPIPARGYTSMPGPASFDSCADGVTTETLATDASASSHRPPPTGAVSRARALLRAGSASQQTPLVSATTAAPSSVTSGAASLGGGSLFLDHDLSPSTSAFSVSPAMLQYGESSLPFAQTASVISVAHPGTTHGLVPPNSASGNATSSSTFSGAGGTPSHLLGMTSGITSLSGAVGASASVTDSSQSFRYPPPLPLPPLCCCYTHKP